MLSTNKLKDISSNMQTITAKRKEKGERGREGEGGEEEIKQDGK